MICSKLLAMMCVSQVTQTTCISLDPRTCTRHILTRRRTMFCMIAQSATLCITGCFLQNLSEEVDVKMLYDFFLKFGEIYQCKADIDHFGQVG